MLLAAAQPNDGSAVRANVLIVEDGFGPNPVCMTVAAPEGKICERFYADTGANRSIHPNSRAAANFYRVELNIGTATGGKSMKSEGVGKLMLYTPSGEKMPGFIC